MRRKDYDSGGTRNCFLVDDNDLKYCSSKLRYIPYWRKLLHKRIITFLMLMKVYLNFE